MVFGILFKVEPARIEGGDRHRPSHQPAAREGT